MAVHDHGDGTHSPDFSQGFSEQPVAAGTSEHQARLTKTA
jgi:hypothetical protein